MSRLEQPNPRLRELILDMEETVTVVVSWAKAFHALGTAPLPIEGQAVSVMAVAFERAAAQLEEQWQEAFSLVVRDREAGR